MLFPGETNELTDEEVARIQINRDCSELNLHYSNFYCKDDHFMCDIEIDIPGLNNTEKFIIKRDYPRKMVRHVLECCKHKLIASYAEESQ